MRSLRIVAAVVASLYVARGEAAAGERPDPAGPGATSPPLPASAVRTAPASGSSTAPVSVGEIRGGALGPSEGAAEPSAGTSGTESRPPSVDLAKAVVESIGATHRALAIVPDVSVSPAEVADLAASLADTKLFRLTTPARADAILAMRRVGGDIQLALVGADGVPKAIVRQPWPAVAAAPEVAPPSALGVMRQPAIDPVVAAPDRASAPGASAPGASAPGAPAPGAPAPQSSPTMSAAPGGPRAPTAAPEEVAARAQTYVRERLSIRPIDGGVVIPERYPGYDFWAGPARERPPLWGWGWEFAAAPRPPVERLGASWAIVRGNGEVLSQRDLAALTGDTQVFRALEQRRRRRVGLAQGILAGIGVAGVASGTTLTIAGAGPVFLGPILIGLGVASGLSAFLVPSLEPERTLSAAQAQALVNAYNEQLRERLGLTEEQAPVGGE